MNLIGNKELIPMRPILIRQFSLLALNGFVSCTTICVVVLAKNLQKLTLDSFITNKLCTENQRENVKSLKSLFLIGECWPEALFIVFKVNGSKLPEIIILVGDSSTQEAVQDFQKLNEQMHYSTNHEWCEISLGL